MTIDPDEAVRIIEAQAQIIRDQGMMDFDDAMAERILTCVEPETPVTTRQVGSWLITGRKYRIEDGGAYVEVSTDPNDPNLYFYGGAAPGRKPNEYLAFFVWDDDFDAKWNPQGVKPETSQEPNA